MRRNRLYFFIILMLICTGCSDSGKKHEDVFYWNLYTGITSMDPAFARIQANIWVVNQLFNGLVQLDDSMNIMPCIAKKWEINEEGTKYTFILRNDVYFHDHEVFPGNKGRKVSAHDFVYSFNRLIDPATASPGAWIFNDKINPEKGKAFVAENDSVFTIHLTKSFPPFLSLLSTQYCMVVPEEALKKFGKDFRANPVGTGPFFMKYYFEGEKLVLHRNPNYFEKENGQHLPYLQAVDISFIGSKQNEFFSFMQEKLDFISGIDQSYKDNLLTKEGNLKQKFEGKLQFEKSPFLNTEYLGFLIDNESQTINPLQQKKVRQAINFAIDRPKMMRYIRNNIGTPGEFGFVPPSLPPFNEQEIIQQKKYYSYNPSKARQLLKEAGFAAGKEMPEIKLATTANYLDLTVFVQKQLQEIGIPVSIENVPTSTLAEWKSQGKSAFFRGSWIADYPDPENYFALFYSKNFPPAGPNYFHFSDPQFDKLYEKAIKTNDLPERNKIYLEMQEILMENPPFVVLFYDEVVRLKSLRVKGLEPNPINLISLKKVRLIH